jgi:hypothetical protein
MEDSMYLIGLDLGQTADYSALCVLEATGGPFEAPPVFGVKRYAVRHLQRWPLGTTYPTIVRDVAALLTRGPLVGLFVPLLVDQTGVGRAVVDMVRAAGLHVIGITLTGGTEVNLTDAWNLKVPKRELVSSLVAAFQSGRLKIARELELAPTLVNELASFKLKINIATGSESYEAWREQDHDDLVLAVGMAVWYGERYFQPQTCAVSGTFDITKRWGYVDESRPPVARAREW